MIKLTAHHQRFANRNGYSVANSLQFSKELSDIEINDNEILVSFDVVSLFTAIPVEKACVYIKKKLEQDATLPSRTNLDIDDITKHLQFTLSNNYFMFNDRIYKQVHGCAMGSPVSPVVANLCMEESEESAISISSVRPNIWKRYVDDSFCIIGKNDSDAVASFPDSLNSIDQHISFTIEQESNGQLPFLDTLISRDNGKLLVDIYRKRTHTDRYLDFHSHHNRKHKISTAGTLLHRALNLPNTQVGKTHETARVCAALHSNGYPKKIAANVVRKKARPPPPTPTPEELVSMFFKWAEPTNRHNFEALPYIKGNTEPLTRILKEHDTQILPYIQWESTMFSNFGHKWVCLQTGPGFAYSALEEEHVNEESCEVEVHGTKTVTDGSSDSILQQARQQVFGEDG
ncbi:uncharacterized protein [Montipora capricornis]|uniref:uncharacterized protein n=1 Tax=Montipora capricornis TaxID=246305 RepID=UPI0035F20905